MNTRKALLAATLIALSTVNIAKTETTQVSSWSELKTALTAGNDVKITNDISASGDDTKQITFSSASTIDGDGYSITGSDNLHYLIIDTATGGTVTMKNLGSYADGSAESNTFSFKDLNDSTVYKTISKSVNSFNDSFIKTNNAITLNIENSVFADNTAKLLILKNDQTLNIKDSIFYNNIRSQDSAALIGNASSNINIDNSIFYGNKAKGEGGVLKNSKTTTIKNSFFINNASTDSFGGVIKMGGGTLKLIDGSIFEGNSAKEDGGAISLDSGATLGSIKNSKFINNTSTASEGGAISTGGGIFKNIENVLFEGNNAKYRGGAIWYGSAECNDATFLIKDTIFKNNEAGTAGAFMAEGYMDSTIYFINTEFTGNKAKEEGKKLYYGIPLGGAILGAGGIPITIINSTFEGNEAIPTDTEYGAGGAAYFAGKGSAYPVHIVDTTFTSNSATEGGAIYIQDADTSIIAASKNVIFSENTASANTDDYNGGADIYFEAKKYTSTLYLNAADEKKITFNGSIAAFTANDNTATIDINKTGITYNTYDGETETSFDAGTLGEIQFNARVGDSSNPFTAINLYGGKLSIGQNADNNAQIDNPDGYLNDNKFYVKGNSILNTANKIIGEFAPQEFIVDSGVSLDYMFDVDLANTKSDKLAITANNGNLLLSSFNVISDTTEEELKVKYSDTNVNGTVKDGYSITTSTKTYDVSAENSDSGSFIIFKTSSEEGGLPAAIANESDQYIITNSKDENVTAWNGNDGNVIKKDMDINANGYSIYTENGIDGMVVSQNTDVILRNIKKLSGFNNALTNNGGTLSIIDSDITGNTGTADITNKSGKVNIIADKKNVKIGSDNTDNALLSDGGTIDVKGSKKVTFNGNVKGSNKAKMNVSTDTNFNGNVSDMNISHSGGTVNLKDLSGAVYTLNDGTLNLNKSGNFAPNTFKLNDGTINIADEAGFSPRANVLAGGNINSVNNKTGNLNFNSLTLRNAINLAVDIDLKKQVMDTISASSVKGSGMIKVNQFNVLSDSQKPKFSIPFANNALKSRVSTDVKTIEGKIFKYNISYDDSTGYFNIIGGGNNSEGYSSSVMAAPVAAQLGGYLTQLNSYDEAFRNMDMYMLMTSEERQALKNKNKIASLEGKALYDETLMRQEKAEGWVRPYATFEKVPLKNGPKVSNVMYGTFIGGESEMYDLGHGWDGIWGAYAGYNGSHQAYDGISIYQNGGTLGLIGMAYKGNFFQGLTVNTGSNGGEASTDFGNDDFTMLMAGVASKTGYNWELLNNKFIVQPSMLMSYSFINTFDFRNSAGVKIDSDPLHAIQLQPQLKVIGNLKNGWQPYASVAMVWNIMDDTKFKANDVSLPEVSVKPFVKYGAGVRKTWGERFTGFFQSYVTNGGRNGVGLQAGFTWTLGKSETKHSTSEPAKKKYIAGSNIPVNGSKISGN